MKRKQFIKASIAIGGSIVGISGGAFLLIDGTHKDDLTVESALNKLDLLSNKNLIPLEKWNPYQILAHCAQSVEYSMSQFPMHRSDLFKNTIGQLAFSIFASKEKMTHGLSKPIPGAPLIHSKLDTAVALNRLKTSLIKFDHYKGRLTPHFTYGELRKSEYEIAHIMH